MKKIFCCLIVLLLLISCSKPEKKSINNSIQEKDSNENLNITTETAQSIHLEDNDLLSNLQELCKSPRRYDTDREQRALKYLTEKMSEYGYETITQELYVYDRTLLDVDAPTLQHYFKYPGKKDSIGKATNLIARLSKEDKKKTLYITTHYDTSKKKQMEYEIMVQELLRLWRLPGS